MSVHERVIKVEQQNEEVLRFWWKVEMSELVSS